MSGRFSSQPAGFARDASPPGAALRVAFYGAGQVSANTSAILRRRAGIEVLGPFGRNDRDAALRGGADVVVIATTSFLSEVAPDIETAAEAGSNVITTAEEAAQPWATDGPTAERIDSVARRHGVTVLGTGLNPGFAFDALVLTVCGVCAEVRSLHVERVVDLSGFGVAVARRIGIGFTAEEFADGVHSGTITGHIGFPQSMRVVGAALGVTIDAIDRQIEPTLAETRFETAAQVVEAGRTAGFRQRYTATASGRTWFEAMFTGHVAPAAVGLATRDAITVESVPPVCVVAMPGLDPQAGSAAVVANSVRRVVAAPPGWLTVADLPPALPGHRLG
jgi:4-hydroxy-tetrahydrodipicolinate reductase